MNILICDDDPSTVITISSVLNVEHNVKTAKNAREGSELIMGNNFDLMITDMTMPCGGGERILNELSARPHIKVIIFSAGLEPLKCRQFSRIGNPAIVKKESGLDKLLQAVNYLEAKKTEKNIQ